MTPASLEILYVGPVLPGSTTQQRAEALRRLGHRLTEVTTTGVSENVSLLSRILLKCGFPLDRARANERMCELVQHQPFDIVWFDKAITLTAETLRSVRRALPKAVRVSYSPDDMTIRPNASYWFRRCLPLFDVHFTTKRHNLTPLKTWGARRVELVENAFAPEIHRPMPRTPADRGTFGGEVGFIGDFETQRAEAILKLAQRGCSVRVWGPNWRRQLRQTHDKLHVEATGLYGNDYVRAISNFDINLAFLRKVARDEVTTRSMEIPACGGFMLAERTDDHLRLFVEGKEAEFFSSDEELLEKCRYYLSHRDKRERIAAGGRQRCIESGYSNDQQLRHMLHVVREIGDGTVSCIG